MINKRTKHTTPTTHPQIMSDSHGRVDGGLFSESLLGPVSVALDKNLKVYQEGNMQKIKGVEEKIQSSMNTYNDQFKSKSSV